MRSALVLSDAALPDPNLFFRTIAYNPNLTGSWSLQVSNPNYPTATFNTSASHQTLECRRLLEESWPITGSTAARARHLG